MVFGHGGEAGAHASFGVDHAFGCAALALDRHMAFEFVIKPCHHGAVDGAKVAVIADIVDDFGGVHGQGAKVVIANGVHPIDIGVLGEIRRIPQRRTAFGVVPNPYRAQRFMHRPAFDFGSGGNGAVVIGNFFAHAVRAELPAVVGANNIVAHNIRAVVIEHHIAGGVVRAQMRLHVGAIGVQQNHFAAGHAAIQGEIAPQKAQRHGFVRQLCALRNHEPATGKGEFAQAVIGGFGHVLSPVFTAAVAIAHTWRLGISQGMINQCPPQACLG